MYGTSSELIGLKKHNRPDTTSTQTKDPNHNSDQPLWYQPDPVYEPEHNWSIIQHNLVIIGNSGQLWTDGLVHP